MNDPKKPLRVRLASCGNPDWGQDPERPLPGVEDATVAVMDFAEASRVCRRYIAEYGLGGGNWSGGQVTDASGAVVALVSYNGRVWPPGEWTPDTQPLWEEGK
jgi:hypothetical protein